MKPQRAFIAAGRAAQHCPELLRRGAAPAELLPQLARLGERICPLLAAALAPLLGGEAPEVGALAPREIGERELAAEIGALAANSLFASGVPGVALLASIDARSMLMLVDRAFGGKGDPPAALPDAFPLSAELLIARVEARLGQCIAEALGLGDLPALRRDPRIAELAPYPAGCRLAAVQLEVRGATGKPWPVTLALPLAALARLPGDGSSAGPRTPRGPANPAAAPFAELPLSLKAVLVDMPVPLASVAALAPGMVLPVAVARSVPLYVGAAPIARGTLGAQDDRLAISLTQIA